MPVSSNSILEDPLRVAALRTTGLLDSAPEEPFDIFTRLARKIFRTPIALVTLVDVDRQFFKSCLGLPEPFESSRQTPLEVSFCKHAVISGEPFIVDDAREHPLLKDNPVVAQGIIAYAGIPLVTSDGYALGSFCVVDQQPRQWTADEIGILKELAAAVMLEIEWRRDLESVRNAVNAKNHFLAVLSHELRTPLAPALMTATLLAQDEAVPERVREDIRLIQRNIELETRLVDDLLDSTRIATGKLRLHLEPIDLHELLKQCVAICAADAAAKDIAIYVDLHAETAHVEGDRGKLSQVFCNILKNSIKFTPEAGRILMNSKNQSDDRIHVQISDSGVGISKEFLPRIFGAFEQGDCRTTQRYGGLGLGLAICKGIVDAHGGTISAASGGQDRGTAMTVGLLTCPVSEVTPAKIVDSGSTIHQLKILLVEDHADTLRAMTRLLQSLHFHVITANSVAKAIQVARESPFDILISDVGLPDGTGIDLIQQLSANKSIKGIALTGYGMEADIQKTREAGFARHLVKPINFYLLQKAIQEIAGQPEASSI